MRIEDAESVWLKAGERLPFPCSCGHFFKIREGSRKRNCPKCNLDCSTDVTLYAPRAEREGVHSVDFIKSSQETVAFRRQRNGFLSAEGVFSTFRVVDG